MVDVFSADGFQVTSGGIGYKKLRDPANFFFQLFSRQLWLVTIKTLISSADTFSDDTWQVVFITSPHFHFMRMIESNRALFSIITD